MNWKHVWVMLIASLPVSWPLQARGQRQVAAPAASPGPSAAPEYKRGKLLFIQCRACHELKAGLPDKVGPSLDGLLGRKSGSKAGFGYSPALLAANITWDKATLDRWLQKPSAVVPGNAMAFAGVADPKDRAALLMYIEQETSSGK